MDFSRVISNSKKILWLLKKFHFKKTCSKFLEIIFLLETENEALSGKFKVLSLWYKTERNLKFMVTLTVQVLCLCCQW
jgi:hypothetical protein